MTADSQLLIAKLTKLRDLLRKNCGTGAGGFQPGNHCSLGRNSGAGSFRRKRAAKNRRKRGPGKKPNPKARQKRGVERQERNQWESRHPEIRAEHHEARHDLASTIRNERAEHREQRAFDRGEIARTVREERNDSRAERRSERSATARRQSRETGRLDAAIGRQNERTSGKPQAVRDHVAEAQRERRAELLEAHAAERADLIVAQREARTDERESHREQITDYRNEEREGRRESHAEHRSQIDELRAEQRRERRGAGKSYSWVNVRAAKDDSVPNAEAILTNALVATGHSEAWEAGTLTADQRRELLEAVVTEGKAWFRSEAEAMLGDVGEKALFGAARAKVGAFFDRAKKHVRELFVAGVLAVTGPGPANQTDAIVQATQQQVAEQIQYLDKFHRQIVAEAKPLDGTFVTRAEMYGAAAHGATIEAQRQAHIAAGLITEALRVLGPAEEHCPECPELAKRGWVPIKRVVPIGRTVCRVNCRCYLVYR